MATLSGVLQKTINIIDESIGLYQKHWGNYAGALLGVFLVTLFIGVINFLVSMLGRIACDSTNPLILLLFCSSFFPFIGHYLIAFLLGFLAVPFTLSLLQPFNEMAERRPISSWILHLSKNAGRALLAALLRLNATAIVWIPFLLLVLIEFSVINSAIIEKMRWHPSIFLRASLLPFLIAAIATVFVQAVLNYFLLFLEPELVLAGKDIFQALRASVTLVLTKTGETLAYAAFWHVVGILLWIAGSLLGCLTCFLNPVIWLIWSFLLYPVQNISLVLLWRRVKEFKEEEKRVVETPVPPEEYIRKAKTKMVLSWE
ncbi:MAG: hypothetical protein QXG98_04785 [Candidatus Micrarchaeia archaeon]